MPTFLFYHILLLLSNFSLFLYLIYLHSVITDIKQIDQADDPFTEIKVGTLAEGTYEIRLGGDGQVRWGTLEVKGEDEPVKVFIGDADLDGKITLNDCTDLCKFVNGKDSTMKTGEEVNAESYASAAYCDGDAEITLNDCTEICKYINGKSPDLVGTKVDLGAYDSAE